MQKLAVIVGHTKKAQGATNYKGVSEYVFNSRVAEVIYRELKDNDEIECRIFKRDKGGLNGVMERVKEWGDVDMSIELHFNSFSKPAYGCEILVLNKEQNPEFEETSKIADKITDHLSEIFSLRERGVVTVDDNPLDGIKELSRKDRGARNLRYMKFAGVRHAMLIEPCFGNFKTPESESIFENEEKYATVLANELRRNLVTITDDKILNENLRLKEKLKKVKAILDD